MKKILDLITEELVKAFEEAGYDAKFAKAALSNRPDLCEYQCNGAMAAAKTYKKAPIMIANDVVEKLKGNPVFSMADAVNPGFINLNLDEAFLGDYLRKMQADPDLSVEKVKEPKKIIIDYGGPNVAKPLHVGHLRSAIIGESIKRMGRFMGHEVIGDVHLGDWGLQMGLIITELKKRKPELFELRCSIEKEGVLVPLLVRKNPHGDGYEIIAGHRRKEAALWAGLTEVPVIIRELDDDQSVIAMVDSNLQREKILPSEKAFAYKMRLEAMKHQGRAEADTSDPLEPKCKTELVNVSELEAELQKLGKVKIQKKGGAEGKRSNEQLASMVGESVTQIKRYIRLTHLIPKILDMVDKEILAIRSAVEISFLSEEEQYELHAVMELEQSIPNISQANRLKRMSQQKCLDMDKIYEILQEIKPNQKEQIKLPLERIGKYFPTAYTPKQQVDLIEKLLKNWAKQNVK